MKHFETIIVEKLTDSFIDLFDNDDWRKAFETGDCDAIIDTLYNSFCDSSFWLIAGITLYEIREFFFEKYGDRGEYVEKFFEITDCYIEYLRQNGRSDQVIF